MGSPIKKKSQISDSNPRQLLASDYHGVQCNVPVKVNDLKGQDHPMQDSNSHPKGPSHL